jgi:hypothetical protein
MDESFSFAIQDHLELQRRNRLLEPQMPLESYRDPRAAPRATVLEDTQEWAMPEAPAVREQEWVMPESPAMLEHEPLFPPAEELWSGTPAFDWGD